jgi:hypothetical protein
MLVTLGTSAMIWDWTCYCFMMIIVVYDLTCKLYTHIIVWNPRPQSESNWDNQRGWLWCEDHMCSLTVNALLRYFIKRSTSITSSSPWGPAVNGLVGQKMSCKFLIASTHDYIRNTCLCLFSTKMLYHYLSAIVHVLIITWIIFSMQARSSIPMPKVFNPTVYYWYHYRLYFTIAATILLLSPL